MDPRHELASLINRRYFFGRSACGIGTAALASILNPSAFGGFADGIPVQDSYVRLPDIPGVGFEAKAELYKLMKTLIEN